MFDVYHAVVRVKPCAGIDFVDLSAAIVHVFAQVHFCVVIGDRSVVVPDKWAYRVDKILPGHVVQSFVNAGVLAAVCSAAIIMR